MRIAVIETYYMYISTKERPPPTLALLLWALFKFLFLFFSFVPKLVFSEASWLRCVFFGRQKGVVETEKLGEVFKEWGEALVARKYIWTLKSLDLRKKLWGQLVQFKPFYGNTLRCRVQCELYYLFALKVLPALSEQRCTAPSLTFPSPVLPCEIVCFWGTYPSSGQCDLEPCPK